jgi:hypothetical protein
MNNKIRKASPSDTARLSASLARAFDDDPIVNWVIHRNEKRPKALELLFNSCISDLCLRHEKVLTTEDLTEVRYGRPEHHR